MIDDVVNIIMRRDHISYNEALHAVELCQEEMREAIAQDASYDEVADILSWWLGLEPDYMEDLLP